MTPTAIGPTAPAMPNEPKEPRMTLRESLIFFAKLAAYLIVLMGVGYAVFALTRSLLIHK